MVKAFLTRLLDGIVGWDIDRRVRKQRASTPAIDWRTLRDELEADIRGYAVYVQLRDDRIVPTIHVDAASTDVVALVAVWSGDGDVMSTEQPAYDLVERLSTRGRVDAFVQLNRDPDTFVGYYVRIALRVQ
jgi:hypothetical protein